MAKRGGKKKKKFYAWWTQEEVAFNRHLCANLCYVL